jgi:hypothetical protein
MTRGNKTRKNDKQHEPEKIIGKRILIRAIEEDKNRNVKGHPALSVSIIPETLRTNAGISRQRRRNHESI